MQKKEHAKVEELLSGKVLYMAVSSKDAVQYNDQSCDCTELIIVTNERTLIVTHDADGMHLKPTSKNTICESARHLLQYLYSSKRIILMTEVRTRSSSSSPIDISFYSLLNMQSS